MNKSLKKLLLLGLISSTLLLPQSAFARSTSSLTNTKLHTHWEGRTTIKVKRASSSGPVGYTPSQIRKAYGVSNVSSTGNGETIAIVDAYGSPTMQSDLNAFSSEFGLSSANLTIAYPNGKPTNTDGGWALETSMDVEWAHAIAPDAKILLVVAKSASDTYLMSAINYATSHGAEVVSNSWGGSEAYDENNYDSYFNHSGVTYLASSGDSGSGVEWPASSPYVVSAGGTTLNIDSTGTYESETGWSGSGGGLSTYVSAPIYQKSVSSIVGNYRGNPDISWVSDPNTGAAVYDTTPEEGETGWFQVGGTSLSSPSLAGVVALIDQSLGHSLDSYDFLTDLYAATSSGYNTDYHDITSGSNGDYSAESGYDLVTGIGSPKVDKLISYFDTNY
ncbi:S53 family peptidase [Clostridium guangxiense]|uniref:S53 family peptidase n=1 Tax=Clostridium guangxiense TaxID=1662055 RepID=UPI001E5912EA|nr:S53 family peptidase [Clostridium guangxiense]MCD2345136.1 S53 family peptidase [Clostridium guangxiense]